MLRIDWDRLTKDRTPPAKSLVGRCHSAARSSRDREEACYRGFSGTDRAEAPAEGIVADLFCLLAAGADREQAASWARERWVAYARRKREQVKQAGKIKFGPRGGQSVRDHEWVSDEHIEDKIRFVFSCLDAWSEVVG